MFPIKIFLVGYCGILQAVAYILHIEVIKRLKGHIRASLLFGQEIPLPGSSLLLGSKTAFQLRTFLAGPVCILEFAEPGLTGLILVLWHIHLPFILAGARHGWGEDGYKVSSIELRLVCLGFRVPLSIALYFGKFPYSL